MNNKDKKYLAGLENRVMRIENILENINLSMQQASSYSYSCNQCGISNPSDDFVCGVPDCCQGLNPEDDNE